MYSHSVYFLGFGAAVWFYWVQWMYSCFGYHIAADSADVATVNPTT